MYDKQCAFQPFNDAENTVLISPSARIWSIRQWHGIHVWHGFTLDYLTTILMQSMTLLQSIHKQVHVWFILRKHEQDILRLCLIGHIYCIQNYVTCFVHSSAAIWNRNIGNHPSIYNTPVMQLSKTSISRQQPYV